MKILYMIPCRLGSQRIPRKNLRLLDGKPLLKYPIDLLLGAGIPPEDIYVNSEADILGDLAKSCGVQFYKRSEKLSTGTATNQDFVADFLESMECDFLVMVNTTSPLLRQDTFLKYIKYLNDNEESVDTLLSVLAEKAETFYKNEPLNFSFEKKVNSQLLEPVSKVIWALTAWRKETFLDLASQGKEGVFGGRVDSFEIPKDECIDLDCPEDWAVAEGFLSSRKQVLEPMYWKG